MWSDEISRIASVLGIIVSLLFVSLAHNPCALASDAADGAEEGGDSSFWDRFIDPEDGRFDLTAQGDGASGMLPLVIPFNDPSVGAGLVAAVAYFHATPEAEDAPSEGETKSPPSTTFGGVAGTSNESWFAAGGHAGVWKEDRIRYLGLLGAGSINLDFYDSASPGSPPLSFTGEGVVLVQQIAFRLGESKVFLGGRYVASDVEISTDALGVPIEGDTKDAGLSTFVEYDARDTTFSPNSGTKASFEISRFAESLGGDFDYYKTKSSVVHYFSWTDRFILGVRAEISSSGSGAPFYALPFISLRGIPALRYLGEYVAVTEVEPRWKIGNRWQIDAFAGVGRAADTFEDLDDAEEVYNLGTGFRYLASRKLGLAVGIDVAAGPEETVPYIIVGSAW